MPLEALPLQGAQSLARLPFRRPSHPTPKVGTNKTIGGQPGWEIQRDK
jgi:hypothetical protein